MGPLPSANGSVRATPSHPNIANLQGMQQPTHPACGRTHQQLCVCTARAQKYQMQALQLLRLMIALEPQWSPTFVPATHLPANTSLALVKPHSLQAQRVQHKDRVVSCFLIQRHKQAAQTFGCWLQAKSGCHVQCLVHASGSELADAAVAVCWAGTLLKLAPWCNAASSRAGCPSGPVTKEAPWLSERVDKCPWHPSWAAQQIVAVLCRPCWSAGAEAIQAMHNKCSQHQLYGNAWQACSDTDLADRTQACQHLQQHNMQKQFLTLPLRCM